MVDEEYLGLGIHREGCVEVLTSKSQLNVVNREVTKNGCYMANTLKVTIVDVSGNRKVYM